MFLTTVLPCLKEWSKMPLPLPKYMTIFIMMYIVKVSIKSFLCSKRCTFRSSMPVFVSRSGTEQKEDADFNREGNETQVETMSSRDDRDCTVQKESFFNIYSFDHRGRQPKVLCWSFKSQFHLLKLLPLLSNCFMFTSVYASYFWINFRGRILKDFGSLLFQKLR